MHRWYLSYLRRRARGETKTAPLEGRRCDSSYPRRGRGVAATRLRGTSASPAAASPRRVSVEHPRAAAATAGPRPRASAASCSSRRRRCSLPSGRRPRPRRPGAASTRGRAGAPPATPRGSRTCAVTDRSSVRTRNSPTFRRDVQQQEKRISTFGYRTQSRTRGKDRSLSRLRTTRRSPWKTPRPGRVPDVAIPLRALERGVSPSKFWRRSRFLRRRSPSTRA